MRLHRLWLVIVVAVGGCTTPGVSSQKSNGSPSIQAPQFMLQMNERREGHTATLLANGNVLICGGRNSSHPALKSAEIYSPSEGFVETGSMTRPRAYHQAVLLKNGKVLIVGGRGSETSEGAPVLDAEVYDPSTGTFTATDKARTGVTRPDPLSATYNLVALDDGRALIITNFGSRFRMSAVLFDAQTRSLLLTGELKTNRYSSRLFARRSRGPLGMIKLKDGRVLVAGGMGARFEDWAVPTFVYALRDAEIYDPKNGTFSQTGDMNHPRLNSQMFMMPDGRVWLAGGADQESESAGSTEFYEPETGTFAEGASLPAPYAGEGIVLNNGMVLFTSKILGRREVDASAVLFDPHTGRLKPTGSAIVPRLDATSVVLADGRVLITGGVGSGRYANVLSSAEVYDPASGTFSSK